MRIVRHPFVLLIVLAAAVVAAGCSDSYDGRVEITGAVKLVGEPIEDGTIQFKPLDNQETTGGAQIVKGEYKVPRQQGLKPGKYLVSISCGDGKTPVNLEDGAAPGPTITNIVSVDRVPEDWNVRSTHEVDVKSNGVNKFNFDIPNVNPKLKRKK
jgi:hypothetical protein